MASQPAGRELPSPLWPCYVEKEGREAAQREDQPLPRPLSRWGPPQHPAGQLARQPSQHHPSLLVHWRPHTGPRGHRTVRSAHRVAGNGVVESPQLMISGRPLKPVRKFALVAATQHARCTLHAEQGAQAAACHSPDTRASCLCPTGWVWGYLVDRYVGVLCVDAILPLLLWGKRDRTTSPHPH